MYRTTLGFVGALAIASPAVAAECRPEFVETSQTVTLNSVEIGVGEFSRETFDVHVRNAGDGACSATIRLTSLGPHLPDSPRYQLRSGANLLEVLQTGAAPTANSDLIVPDVPIDDRGAPVRFELTLPTEWGLKAGTYDERVELLLLDGGGNEVDRLIVALNITIPQAVALRLVGATGEGQIARIDLGPLSTTAATRSEPFGVRIWSTSGYRVGLVSQNRGLLMHEANLDSLEYTLEFDDRAVDLKAAPNFVYPQFTPSLGRIHPMRVWVGPVTARAGRYADRVTVTVTAI
jgi:hypothetical protein